MTATPVPVKLTGTTPRQVPPEAQRVYIGKTQYNRVSPGLDAWFQVGDRLGFIFTTAALYRMAGSYKAAKASVRSPRLELDNPSKTD